MMPPQAVGDAAAQPPAEASPTSPRNWLHAGASGWQHFVLLVFTKIQPFTFSATSLIAEKGNAAWFDA